MTILIATSIVLLMLVIGRATTDIGPWYRNLNKPSWNPPDWLFGPAWAVILGLAGWAGVEAWGQAQAPAEQWRILILFGLNIVLHMLWSPLFFNLKRPDWALMEIPLLWLSILALIIGLAPMSTLAAALLIPYLLWVAFASFLNLTIVRLNPRVRAQPSTQTGPPLG